MKPSLTPRHKATLEALMPAVLGLETPSDLAPIGASIDRLDTYLSSLPQQDRVDDIRLALTAMGLAAVVHHRKWPSAMTPDERSRFIHEMFDSSDTDEERVIGFFLRVFGPETPTLWDLAKSFRELCVLAYYSNPASNPHTGYVPLWEKEAALEVEPATKTASPYTHPDRVRLDYDALVAKHAEGIDKPADKLFRHDGRPKVAIIGSGCGGAAAAAQLAADYDVAVFEAGPMFAPGDYPIDHMAGMSLLYDSGLLTPTKDLDVRLLVARVVGGGSAINEGVSVRPRPGLLDSWSRGGAGFDREELEAALDAVRERQRFELLNEELSTDVSHLWAAGGRQVEDVMFQPVLSDIASHAHQHRGSEPPGKKGDRCIACGLCNFGCRFGHHLTVDRTFLWDARQAGALVHANMGVRNLVAGVDRRTGQARITGLGLYRDPYGAPVEVDAVVLAAGAVGSPALMLRSIRRQDALARLPGARRDLVGNYFGLNYGTPVIARWNGPLKRPGQSGIQTHFIASKPGDERWIMENGFVPPAILGPTVPGIGREHRRLMGEFPNLGFAVNTIGSRSTGRVDAQGHVSFMFDDDDMKLIHHTLAILVDGYLHSGAVEAWIGGVQPQGLPRAQFGQQWRGRLGDIEARLRQVVPRAEHLSLGSGHPQGGMRMNKDPEVGVVGPDFRVHGTRNLFVADASVFPTTLTVNPQWLVMALGKMGGEAARVAIAREAGHPQD